MKKLILSLILFVGFATIGLAQTAPKGTPESRAKGNAEKMAKELSLNPEQKAKIYEATLERAKGIDALWAAAGEGNKPDPKELQAVARKFNDIVKTILTPEQMATQKALAEAQRAKAASNQ